MRFRQALGVLFALAVFVASAATASSAPAGGTIQIWVTPGNGAASRVVVTGAIGDYGTGTSIDKNGKVDQNGNYEKVSLKHGGFEVNAVAFNKVTSTEPPKMVDKSTCSLVFGGAAPATLFNGTGQYAGITGIVHLSATFAGVGGRYASGAKKGQCQGNNAQPLAFWGSITGTGVVKYK